MKNIFKILFLLAITLVILSLASCGNNVIDLPDDSEQNAEDIPDESEEDKENTFKESGESECKHVYEEKVLLAATCQKEGITKKTCTLCKKTESVTVPKAAHVEVTDAAIAATCTASGKTEGKHCSVCNEVTVPQETIDALGHTEVIDKAIAATCTAPGKTEGKHCSVCEEVLVLQKHIDVLGHSTVKRTHTPVTCQANGIVEIYCTRCETVQNYETILKGHYSEEHEYTQITHESIGNLCVGYKHGDKCELCNTRFIAPGTYTVMGAITEKNMFTEIDKWTGKERFNFDYTIGNKTYSAQSFGIAKEDTKYFIEINGEKLEALDSLVITITEEYLAEVSDGFYNEIFLKYFEKGEYALSGKYTWYEEGRLVYFTDIEQEINFTYSPKNSTSTKGTKIIVIEQLSEPGVIKNVIRYDTYYQPAISWETDPHTEWIYNVEREIDFGAESQTVSKEFFEWFTSVAEKVTG